MYVLSLHLHTYFVGMLIIGKKVVFVYQPTNVKFVFEGFFNAFA
jgi:hypothetical protein